MKKGIYIHIPFCVRKCNYCAFLSFDAYSAPRKEYTDALVREIGLRAALTEDIEQIDTVYIGGGTPSVLDVSQLRDIMHAVNGCYDVKPDAEVTLEANPATLGVKDGVTLAKLQAYRSIGVNRLSMGVQAMDNDRLHYLGRLHTCENVVRDMELIRKKGFGNVSLDLMFSVPGQTTEDALEDLEKVLALGPEHISCYSLQIEEGTPFGEMAAAGELAEVPDEDDRRTYHEICRVLGEAGYEHYEISNFAKPGFRAEHNSLYWNMDDYIAFGLGASGFVSGVRYRNTEDIEEYIALLKEGRLPAAEEHINTAFDNISEAVFTGLRRIEGITYEEAAEVYFRAPDANGSRPEGPDACRGFFWDIFSEAEKEAWEYVERGLLVIDEKGLRLTEQGIDISNSIMSLFV